MKVEYSSADIDAYLFQSMNTFELEAFELEMERNPRLAKEVATQRALIETLHEIEKDEFMEMIKDSEDPDQTKGKGKWFLMVLVPFAAAAICLIWFTGPNPAEQLAQKYFDRDLGWPNPLGGGYEHSPMQEAMALYRGGSLDNAKVGFLKLLEKTPDSDTLNFFLAQIDLSYENPSSAIEHLKKVELNPDSQYFKPAEWFRALAKLSLGRKVEARTDLERIVENPRHYYRRDALGLLGEMEQKLGP